jgi:hypothetical protein
VTNGTSRRRAWLAAGLSLLLPGLGHAYLRRWARMALWFGFMIAFAAMLVVVPIIPTETIPQEFTFDAFVQFQRSLPTSVDIARWLVTGLIAADAFVIARQETHEQTVESGQRCPECGKELEDDSLSFCPWCAAELESTADADEPRP